jgi:hypothetical protein
VAQKSLRFSLGESDTWGDKNLNSRYGEERMAVDP